MRTAKFNSAETGKIARGIERDLKLKIFLISNYKKKLFQLLDKCFPPSKTRCSGRYGTPFYLFIYSRDSTRTSFISENWGNLKEKKNHYLSSTAITVAQYSEAVVACSTTFTPASVCPFNTGNFFTIWIFVHIFASEIKVFLLLDNSQI